MNNIGFGYLYFFSDFLEMEFYIYMELGPIIRFKIISEIIFILFFLIFMLFLIEKLILYCLFYIIILYFNFIDYNINII